MITDSRVIMSRFSFRIFISFFFRFKFILRLHTLWRKILFFFVKDFVCTYTYLHQIYIFLVVRLEGPFWLLLLLSICVYKFVSCQYMRKLVYDKFHMVVHASLS